VIHPFSTARRRAVSIAAAAVLLAVGGGATAAFAAAGDGTPSPATSPAACRVHLQAELLGAAPQELKVDLKKLRSEPKGAQRTAERTAIREKALSGAYGSGNERLAHIVAGSTAKSVRATLPAALKADLKTLRGQAKGTARQTEAKKIEQKALAGDYGTTIRSNATTVQARFQARCTAATAK
jgi:hypothetical protein